MCFVIFKAQLTCPPSSFCRSSNWRPDRKNRVSIHSSTYLRPRPPFSYPCFPLYVCDSRYNDYERAFVKLQIKKKKKKKKKKKDVFLRKFGRRGGRVYAVYLLRELLKMSPFLVGRGGLREWKGRAELWISVRVGGNGVNGAGGNGDNIRKKLRSPGRIQQQQQQENNKRHHSLCQCYDYRDRDGYITDGACLSIAEPISVISATWTVCAAAAVNCQLTSYSATLDPYHVTV